MDTSKTEAQLGREVLQNLRQVVRETVDIATEYHAGRAAVNNFLRRPDNTDPNHVPRHILEGSNWESLRRSAFASAAEEAVGLPRHTLIGQERTLFQRAKIFDKLVPTSTPWALLIESLAEVRLALGLQLSEEPAVRITTTASAYTIG